MAGVAWCACTVFALISLAAARTFGRCELARELRALGIEDNLSTWVCIAFHESRLDTAAQNPHSGDHGLLQISELFWCGTGKACGVPCAALRDDDIEDDVRCALQIHEEHTRLQGDGFLAWVVYPQHCKHNTKKYLVDCDMQLNDINVREKPNILRTNLNHLQNPDIDDLKPPYLSIKSIVRAEFGNSYYRSRQKNARTNWYDYKIDNIDMLKLPVFRRPEAAVVAAPPPPLTTIRAPPLTTTKAPPVTTTRAPPATATRAPPPTPPPATTAAPTFRKPNFGHHILTDTYVPRVLKPVYVLNTSTATSILTTTESPKTTAITSTTSKPRTQKPSSPTPTTPQPTPATTRRAAVETTTAKSPSIRFKFPFTSPLPISENLSLQTTTRRVPVSFFTDRPAIFNRTNIIIEPRRGPSTELQSYRKAFADTTTTVRTTTRGFSTEAPKSAKSTTESVFDLYLNTRRPTLTTYSFAPFSGRHVKLIIFGGGSTTPLPALKRGTGAGGGFGAARNQVRRRAPSDT